VSFAERFLDVACRTISCVPGISTVIGEMYIPNGFRMWLSPLLYDISPKYYLRTCLIHSLILNLSASPSASVCSRELGGVAM
jgi:hypothetical protein